MIKLNLPPQQIGSYNWSGHRPLDDGCACGAEGDFRGHLCDVFSSPASVRFVDRGGISHDLIVTSDKATGTVWVPVWLVHENPAILGWIANVGLIGQDDCEGGRSIYRVPRHEWHPRMGSLRGSKGPRG
jgi:hypothetical protein